jgi:hypothetical protein
MSIAEPVAATPRPGPLCVPVTWQYAATRCPPCAARHADAPSGQRAGPLPRPREEGPRPSGLPLRVLNAALLGVHEEWPQVQRFSRAMGVAMGCPHKRRLRPTWCLVGPAHRQGGGAALRKEPSHVLRTGG